ncbi:MAG: cytochrome b/b6 domain-containing protein [Acetobacteraceae bacterium]
MRQLYLPMPVWDLPIRLFHWLIVALVGFSWLSGENGWMEWHMWSGYAILSLLLFRLVWGFVGSDTARFVMFLKSPVAALRHLAHIHRREPDTEIGHNAAGGWMVLVMLGLLFAQVFTGLASNDDVFVEGPLARAVGKETSDWLTGWHHELFDVLLVAIALHVFAIIIYAVVKRHNLALAMITGKKRMPGAMRGPRMVSPLLAAVIWVIAALAVFALVRWAP